MWHLWYSPFRWLCVIYTTWIFWADSIQMWRCGVGPSENKILPKKTPCKLLESVVLCYDNFWTQLPIELGVNFPRGSFELLAPYFVKILVCRFEHSLASLHHHCCQLCWHPNYPSLNFVFLSNKQQTTNNLCLQPGAESGWSLVRAAYWHWLPVA